MSSGRLARLRKYAEEETANEASFARGLEDAKEGASSEDVAGGMGRALHAIGSGDMSECKGYCAKVYDLVVRRHRAQFSALKGLLGEISGRPLQDFEYNIGRPVDENLQVPATQTGLLDIVRRISEADDILKRDAEASARIQRSRENGTPEVKAAISNWDRFSTAYKTFMTAAEVGGVAAFLVKLRDENDPYNTRKKKGLPPTPIGAPTQSSLEAALRPTPSEFLYYLHDAKKQLHPSRDAAEHEAMRKKYDVY